MAIISITNGLTNSVMMDSSTQCQTLNAIPLKVSLYKILSANIRKQAKIKLDTNL